MDVTMQMILFIIVAAAFHLLKENATVAFMIVFVCASNSSDTKGPTRFRATSHGLSAAYGKTEVIIAAIQCVGLLATIWLMPESKGL